MTHLILATRNRHKIGEVQGILGPTWPCRSLLDFSAAPELVEDGQTFAENAVRKAEQFASWLVRFPELEGSLVLADDSGLEVDVLQGAPGVLSARFASGQGKGNAPDAANNAKLLDLLRDVPPLQRTARFRCCLAIRKVGAVAIPASASVFEGACEGTIAFRPKGEEGFGYDPLFLPQGDCRTFAELSETEKNRISHRRAALEALRVGLLSDALTGRK